MVEIFMDKKELVFSAPHTAEIGNTTFIVETAFNPDAKETLSDKIKRLALDEIERETKIERLISFSPRKDLSDKGSN